MYFKPILAAAAIALASSTAVSALTIDTNPTWDGSVNSGWAGSGQSLTVVSGNTELQDISFYFDQASAGLNFTFTLTDQLVGGSTFYTSNFSVLTGINTFATNVDLAAGSTVYALFDYNGYTGASAHFSFTDGYAGGQSFFNNGTWDTSFTGLDHRFIANFGSTAVVPLPAGGILLLSALGGFAAFKRRKTRAA